jgi:hypothetical protein
MERACLENIIFMALCCGYSPDHSTIAHFVSSMQKEIESIFCYILLVCDQLDLLGGTHFSLDGVKLSANVAKEWSGTFEELKNKRDKLQNKLQQVLSEHMQSDSQPELDLERQEKREKRLQFQIERLNQFLEQQKPKLGSEGNQIQSNVIDNQSVKMPSSHGVIQGYNAQAWVDSKHQVILAAEAFSSQDHENLAPMLKGAKKNVVAIGKAASYFHGKQLTADSNYHSFEALSLCKTETIDAYIPDIQFRKRDRVSLTSNVSRTASSPGNHNPPKRPPSPLQISLWMHPTKSTFALRGINWPATLATNATAIALMIFTTPAKKSALPAP